MFRATHRPSSGAQKIVIAASGFIYVFGCRPLRWLIHRNGILRRKHTVTSYQWKSNEMCQGIKFMYGLLAFILMKPAELLVNRKFYVRCRYYQVDIKGYVNCCRVSSSHKHQRFFNHKREHRTTGCAGNFFLYHYNYIAILTVNTTDYWISIT
jgi:hypothetical protein